jgi:LAO/AO transport system kinase
MSLAESILSHPAGAPDGRLALARLLTQIENGEPAGREALAELFPHTGRAHLIGVTGAPGTGKSSLVNRLAYHYRHPPEGETPRTVAVVAVDPSSPFTGGALLGDRVRMRDLAGDPGVFIRSMAARGALGGLAPATASMVQALDAAGFQIIFIETVGAGQAEVDIARLAHTTLVVEAPGLGDEVQAIKAGILEIADILVVNKADRPGVENTERALRSMLELGHPHPGTIWHHGRYVEAPAPETKGDEKPSWTPPILRTVATEGVGIAELGTAIARHQAYLEESGEKERRERARLEAELDALLRSALVSRWRASLPEERYREVMEKLIQRRLSPWEAVEQLVNNRK